MTLILDTDAYILSMENAVLQLYPEATAEFRFLNRRPSDKFDGDFKKRLDSKIEGMAGLRLTDEEAVFLANKMPYLGPGFLEYLRNYRYNPSEVKTEVNSAGELSIDIFGKLRRVGFWEVPLMSTISEEFFGDWQGHDKLWDNSKQVGLARSKAAGLYAAGCSWSDFGTRRRRSYESQDIVVRNMKDFAGFSGTSNVHFAMKHGVKPIGTVSHWWFQAHSALGGMRHANRYALDAWAKVYRGSMGIALTDTFGTDSFFEDFDLYLAKLFDGIRQDSGKVLEFADKAVAHYRKLGIDPSSKTIVFSDSLDVEKCIEIKRHCNSLGIKCAFGIGTFLTNSYPDSPLKALNMVIKMVKLDGIPVVKLSDDPSKAIGDRDALRVAKWVYFGTPLDESH